MILRSMMVALMVGFAGLVLPLADAEAKRLGGGLSFGGKKSFSSPQKRSSVGQKDNKAATGNAAGAGQTAAKGGMAGGMLGGLLAGGLLGALFFGGAFENVNFMDILIFGVIAFLLFRLLARRRGSGPAYANAAGNTASGSGDSSGLFGSNQYRTSDQDYSGSNNSATGSMRKLVNRFSKPERDLPGFDQTQFLNSAKTAFEMLQKAWDDGDLSELRGYTTDAVFAEIQQQFQGRDGDNSTEIVQLDAQLLHTGENEREQEASVLFTAVLREIDNASGLYPEPQQLEEIWHFVKPVQAIKPTWYLDGIQQVED